MLQYYSIFVTLEYLLSFLPIDKQLLWVQILWLVLFFSLCIFSKKCFAKFLWAALKDSPAMERPFNIFCHPASSFFGRCSKDPVLSVLHILVIKWKFRPYDDIIGPKLKETTLKLWWHNYVRKFFETSTIPRLLTTDKSGSRSRPF